MPVNPFNSQNLGVNGLSFDFQQAMHFQPVYPTRTSLTIDSTKKESQKDKMVKQDDLNKFIAIE